MRKRERWIKGNSLMEHLCITYHGSAPQVSPWRSPFPARKLQHLHAWPGHRHLGGQPKDIKVRQDECSKKQHENFSRLKNKIENGTNSTILQSYFKKCVTSWHARWYMHTCQCCSSPFEIPACMLFLGFEEVLPMGSLSAVLRNGAG